MFHGTRCGALALGLAASATIACALEPLPTAAEAGDGLGHAEADAGADQGQGCVDRCTFAETTQCVAGGFARCADYDADGCLEWGPPTACPSGNTCVGGVCGQHCESSCAVGATRCRGTAAIERCADLDGDGCPEWAADTGCTPPMTCTAGQCLCGPTCTAGETRCDGELLETCQFDGVTGCMHFGVGQACGEGFSCEGGFCVCEDLCVEGETRCTFGNREVCGDSDRDGCMRWENMPCATGSECVEGACECLHVCEPGVITCFSSVATVACVDIDGCPAPQNPLNCGLDRGCSDGECSFYAHSEGAGVTLRHSAFGPEFPEPETSKLVVRDMSVIGDELLAVGVANGNIDFVNGPGVLTFDQEAVVLSAANPGSSYFVEWVARLPSDDFVALNGAAGLDGAGGLVVGEFGGTLTLDGGGANEVVLTASGLTDGFVARYDGTGGLSWARSLGGSGVDSARAVAVTDDGGAWVVGNFVGPAEFQVDGASTQTVEGAEPGGSLDAYVARFDAAGTLQSVTALGGSAGSDRAQAVVAGPSGAVIGGTFLDRLAYGGTVHSPGSGSFGFVATVAGDGSVDWVQSYREAVIDDVALAPDGHIAVAGQRTTETAFVAPGGGTVPVDGSIRAFAARLDPAGGTEWVVGPIVTQTATAAKIAFDNDGRILLAGEFAGSVTFGASGGIAEPTRRDFFPTGAVDTYVASYDAEARLGWARTGTGASAERTVGLGVRGDGTVVVGAAFTGTYWLDLGVSRTGEEAFAVAELTPG